MIATGKDPSVRVRFPKKVLRELDQIAARNGRSRNSEIVTMVAESIRQEQARRETPVAA